MLEPRYVWAPQAWLTDAGRKGGAWHSQVLLTIQADGHWGEIKTRVQHPPVGTQVLAGALIPSLVNAHSHAFQRAFAGLAERREADGDDFWSWRDRMYRVALRVRPDHMRAIAAQLYVELLRGGYTQVCEFHYLHREQDGSAYEDPLAMCWALADAAQEAGLGATFLPVLYERAGFAEPALRPDQRRFHADAHWAWNASQRISAAAMPWITAGVALHSLRAVAPESFQELLRLSENWQGPIHIHVAEQTAEVNDCLKHRGLRPIDWLGHEGYLDPRWHLVHATHSTPDEVEVVAKSGASVVICPSTEANLGDGYADLPAWLSAGVPISIGSDSHVSRDAMEELRWMEYGQRLALRQRNIVASPNLGQPSTAARLYEGAVYAGASAAGFSTWGIAAGARADALMLPPCPPALLGVPMSHWLDALMFSSPSPRWGDVMVAGQWVMRQGQHPREAQIADRFAATMAELWGP